MSRDKPADNEDDFASQMLAQGVKPLTNNDKAAIHSKSPKSASSEYRKKNAQTHQPVQISHDTTEHSVSSKMSDSIAKWYGPHDIIEFRRQGGLQHKAFKDF